ncbi:oxidoreductase [Endozoicomonas montiporae]|uniref:Oxidoreductase n=2 Tax=Endozoicomonas montiporae TaxID=1027273 RepID=A0A081N4I4_9GAMM|nr:SDR family oxidoreductase [Endozoicomonas montiporae]AMO57785.1 3-ketoacyl-ACP reductase [Endozoicomonas montiporae CL-33]KEQ13357.1 oxidoreductase [Endozoicomonas montiporae]
MKRKDFPDGAALVIGGSGGAGRAICLKLVESNVPVVFTYNKNQTRANELVNEITELGGEAQAIQLNVSDQQGIKELLEQTSQQYKQIHTLIMAIGYDIPQDYLANVTPELWQSILQSDVNGFFNVTHAAIPYLRESQGSIVHISSAGLFRYPPRDVLSVAPKAAIEVMIKAIAKEEGKYGIRANSVAIGVIETGIFLRLKETVFDEAWQEAVKAGLCLPRFGQAEEVAEAAIFLASSKSSYTTGQIITVDGGYHV